MSRDPRLRILLAILFAVSVLFQSVSTYGVFDKLLHGSERPAMPLEFGMRGPAVTYASSEAVRAGIRLDDVLTEVGGRPFTGRAVLQDAIRRKHPGDPLSLTVRKGGGETVSVSVPLGAEEKRPLDSSDWLPSTSVCRGCAWPWASGWRRSVPSILWPGFCWA